LRLTPTGVDLIHNTPTLSILLYYKTSNPHER